MEFKEELSGQATMSSSDVTAAGASSDVNVNQPLIEPAGSMESVVPPVGLGAVVGQPQSTVTHATSPSAEAASAEPAGPPSETYITPSVTPDSSQPNEAVNQPCPSADQLPCPLSASAGQQAQQSDEAIAAAAQVSPAEQLSQQQHLHSSQPQSAAAAEPLSALIQNIVIAEPSADLQPSLQQPAAHPSSTDAVQQPQQPAGMTMTEQQLPGQTAVMPVTPVASMSAAGTTSETVQQQQQQHVNEISPVEPQQPGDGVTAPDQAAQPALSTVELRHQPATVLSPETAGVQQPTEVSAAMSTIPQTDAASQQLPNTVADVTDEQPVNISDVCVHDQQNAAEPVAQQLLPTESMPPSTVESVHSPDVASAAVLQQPCPPAVDNVSDASTQPSANVEPQPSSVEQQVPQPETPKSPELPTPDDVAFSPSDSSHIAQPTPPPPAAAHVSDSQQQELMQVQPAPSVVDSSQPNISPVESQVTQPTTPPAAAQVGDNQQMQETEVKQTASEQLPPSAVTSEEPNISPVESQVTQPTPPAAAAQVGDNQLQEAIQVQQQTYTIADKHPQQHEDVVKATLNDVIDMHDVSAGSDTDDAPEVISDSLSRDHDATNQHDHPHPPV